MARLQTTRLTRMTGSLVVASLVVGALAAVLVGPRPPDLGDERTGDPALAARTLDALGGPDHTAGHRGLAVAWVEDGTVTTAGLGTTARGPGGTPVDGGTPFEIGSVTKAMTGMLLADAVARGEVVLDEPVAGLVPGTALADTGAATLAELATHRSGLPRLDPSPGALVRGLVAQLTAGNPYAGSARDVLDAAGRAGAPGGGAPEYSNLGYAALGDALAARVGTPYPQLLRDRLFAPLGMGSSVVATTDAQVPDGTARSVSGNGREQAFWCAEGYAPAGSGVISTAADLAALAAAALDGSAPGVAALDPLAALSDGGDGDGDGGPWVGLGWVTQPADPATGTPEVTWHDGGTGGASSYVGLDRGNGRAVVILATGTDSVAAAGAALLAEAARGGR